MLTANVDIAAYLHLSGVEPKQVTWNNDVQGRMFHYEDTPMLKALMKAFDNGAMVPVKAFAEARAEMKGRPHDKKVGNFRKAVSAALHQTRRK